MGRKRAQVATLLVTVVLTGCQTDEARLGERPATAMASAHASPSTQPAQGDRLTALFEAGKYAPVELAGVRIGFDRSTRIGVSTGAAYRCLGDGSVWIASDVPLHWNDLRAMNKDDVFADEFIRTLKEAGLDIAGDPSNLFEQEEDKARALFAIAGEVTKLDLTVCEESHWWTGHPTGGIHGDGAIEVRWQVYDKLKRKVVGSFTTAGHGEAKRGDPYGHYAIVRSAFSEAVLRLAGDAEFRELLEVDRQRELAALSSAEPQPFFRVAAFAGSLSQHAEQVRQATVTIDMGNGHGSGFIIDSRGFILTNEHVVGARRTVRIRLLSGEVVFGEVLRRDKVRDVALVKMESGEASPLPIRESPVTVAESVYAIGAPLDRRLSNTVTKGVVSGVRRERNGLIYIQADVNIQQGNSGGPLVDEAGNVVGISVMGLRIGEAMTGINFFIPIRDALDRLNLKLIERPGAS
jgi:S1-C subfamily serine protease